jgi:sulfatase maturation enzyme AslB (radical SAM superfamily)/radical SAM superfamily enzyme YgiQ (UPF0313 family)
MKKNKPKNKILFFKNIFSSPVHEFDMSWMSPATHYLASSVHQKNEIIFSDSKIDIAGGAFITKEKELGAILNKNKDINFIVITLCEDYFDQASRLVAFLRAHSSAFIAVGGVMPTLTPYHVLMHLGADLVVRGAGELVLPKLMSIINGANAKKGLSKEQCRKILGLNGVLYRHRGGLVSANIDKINWIKNYDDSKLDFSFFTKEDVVSGLNLYTARGCKNYCIFCTIPGRGRFAPKSIKDLKDILERYHKRLIFLFGKNNIPPKALSLAFNDDDFLSDQERAIEFFKYIRKSPFKISFLQTGINAFYIRAKNNSVTNKLNRRLLNSITPDLFYEESDNPNGVHIYIGTENYNDTELLRLGKGYNNEKTKKVVAELSKRKIIQAHHLIVSNVDTEPEAIFDNLIKILELKIKHGKYFNVLLPPITYLVSLFPSLSYQAITKRGLKKYLNISKVLRLKGRPEYDYPLVVNDIPKNEITAALAPLLEKRLTGNSPEGFARCLDEFLLFLLYVGEEMKNSGVKKTTQIDRLIEKYGDYPGIIKKTTGFGPKNDLANIQLMITNRCQLRCKYCPVIKGFKDMDEKTLYRSIDLLFTSSRNDLRLDFTGGEPLLRFDLVEKGVAYARKKAKLTGKNISFYLVTNLILMDDRIADFLEKEGFSLEISIDGREKFHNLYKTGLSKKTNSYRITREKFEKIVSRSINYQVVMVVAPSTVKHLLSNFSHIIDLGAGRVGINYALGLYWSDGEVKEFTHQLDLIRRKFSKQLGQKKLFLNNLDHRNEPAILNGELLVNPDGTYNFLSDWFFAKESGKKIPPLGHLALARNINDIFMTKFHLLRRLFKWRGGAFRKIIMNNIEMGEKIKKEILLWTK